VRKYMSKLVDRMFWPIIMLGCTGVVVLAIIAYPSIKAQNEVTPMRIQTTLPVPRTTIAPTASVNKPTQQTVTVKENDPIIKCEVEPQCGGGYKMIRRSACEMGGCCEIHGQWILYESEAQCRADQREEDDKKRTYQQTQQQKQQAEQQKIQDETGQVKNLLYDMCLSDAKRKADECDKSCSGDTTCINACTSSMSSEQNACFSKYFN
jgi:hypothetical protein